MRFTGLRNTTFVFIVTIAGLMMGLVPRAEAQLYAAIHGTVADTSGAVVPNATVTVLNNSTGIKTVVESDKTGYFILPQLQVGGPYTVTVSCAGFKTFQSTGLTLNVNDNREVDAKLGVGGESQTVEVSATAVQVETSNTQLQQIATAEQLEGIPLEGRDPAGLQKLEPGVVESSDRFGTFSSNGNETPQNSYMLDGVDINDPSLQSEGIQINPDALQEENIVTSTMNPEFARNSGAVINQVLKSGTNKLHGSGFEFYRDTFLNNGNYFSNSRPVFHQNLYGGTLGGPIIRNKLFFFAAYQGQRQRSAFSDIQPTLDSDQFAGNFSNNPNYANGGVPDGAPSVQNGVAYTDSLSTNPMPFAYNGCAAGTPWAACFSNGASPSTPSTISIPTSTWNTVASNLITKYVLPANFGAPDLNGQQSNVDFNPLNLYAADQGILRFDYTVSSKDSLWASSVFQSNPAVDALAFGGSGSLPGGFPGFGETSSSHFKLFSASWTHTFSTNKLNELRASYYRNPFGALSPTQVVAPSSVGFAINPQNPESGIPAITIGSLFNLGFSFEGPQPRLDTNLTYADNFTWVLGNHSIKFGGSFEQFRVHNPFDVDNNGNYSFNGAGGYSSGDPLLDFSLGIPDSYEQTNNGFINAVAEEIYGYVQDNWKVNSDFTFNYGLAWDVEKPNQNHQDGGLGIVCWANSTAESTVFPGASPGLSFPGDPGCNNAGSPVAHYNRFAPRIGFAWSPSSGPSRLIGTPGSHDLSVRAGFGVFYNRDQEEQSLQNLEDPPFLQFTLGAADFGGNPSLTNPFVDVAGNGSEPNPAPFTPVTPTSKINWNNYLEEELAVFNSAYSVPYTYNFNLNVQRALGSNLVAQVGFVGSNSHRLATWYEGDPITAAGHAACLADTSPGGCASSPFFDRHYPQYMTQTANVDGIPYYLTIGDQNSEGHSNYNSFQASLIKAPSHGLQFTVAYTYSHSLDDGSGYEGSTGANNRVRNYTPGFTYLNYGDSDFDARHRIVGSYVYTVPVFAVFRSNAILRETLSGWGIGGVTALQSGFPIGIEMGTQRSFWCSADSYFGCADNPEYTGAPIKKLNIRSSTNQYFDTTPFSAETIGTFGNTSRNFFHGPGFDYTNLQLSKNIHFSPDAVRYVQLRVEAFNAFNHANFANPVGNFSSPQFGIVTSVIQSAEPNADPQPGRAVQLVGKLYF
ncbi:MAG: carboxypeptidase-like regulatory domain-containing protein [Terracidiphilus sp.]|jgi:hypothetical protein